MLRPAMTASVLFTLGTRGSPLALAQANEARRLLGRGARLGDRAHRASGHPHQRRPHPGPAAGRGRRQGPVHQGDRRRAPRRRDRRRGPFGQGPAVAHARGRGDRGLPRSARTCATLSSPRSPIRSRACRPGRPSAPPRSAARLRRLRLRPDLKPDTAARQCRDAAQEGRGRRDRRDAAGARRPQAARPRRSRPRGARRRRLPARARSGRDRDHRAQRRCARARGARADLGRRDLGGARGRARLSGRARRLLPHSDRRPRPP